VQFFVSLFCSAEKLSYTYPLKLKLMYKKINQGLMAAMLLFTVFATACSNEGEKTEPAADTPVVTPAPEPAADTTAKDTTVMDTTGVQKPVIKTN
jgi:hypothetical protein